MKKQPELTPWFSIARQGNPARPGYYDIRYEGDSGAHDVRYYFDGEGWTRNKGGGSTMTFGGPRWPKDAWRGLASNPEVSK